MPKRREHGRPDPPCDDQFIETVEVFLFLFRHAADDLACLGAAKHGQLPVIDPLGAEFSGMIDPDHGIDGVAHRAVTGQESVAGVRLCVTSVSATTPGNRWWRPRPA